MTVNVDIDYKPQWVQFTIVDEHNIVGESPYVVNNPGENFRFYHIADVLADIRYSNSTFICCPVER